MRCKIDYLEALKENLEKFLMNRGIEVVENSPIIMNVYVYELDEKRKITTICFNGVCGGTTSLSFTFE